MKILHTADWHLGDRLGRIDRTDDLRRGVERIAEYCRTEAIDVLLVAGDIFSESARSDGLREAIAHLQETFTKFLRERGTIVAITGNHDNESFCQTLWHTMNLAAPADDNSKPASLGRLHLATGPAFLRLPDRHAGFDVQFVLMPFPTPRHYLHDEPAQKYASLDEKNRHLSAAFARKLKAMTADPNFRADQPSVLSAHLTVMGRGERPMLFRLLQEADIMLPDTEIPPQFSYVALGHIHKPHAVAGKSHVRYCGSIDRLDIGERENSNGVVVFEIGPQGLIGEPETLPLDATPIYEITINDPDLELPTLPERFPDAQRDLVKLHVSYTAGMGHLDQILRELDRVFPRWYDRDWKETGELGPTLVPGEANRGQSFVDTVRDYLTKELMNHEATERTAVLERAEALMRELDS